mmetsp:Transcript_4752/g.10797  ORF Transcript_4752/g.10797 Transcript_4752/m.10797 type:complete len:83 (-) Transcript_4752:516-764(-)
MASGHQSSTLLRDQHAWQKGQGQTKSTHPTVSTKGETSQCRRGEGHHTSNSTPPTKQYTRGAGERMDETVWVLYVVGYQQEA